jgi:hypothetical protein
MSDAPSGLVLLSFRQEGATMASGATAQFTLGNIYGAEVGSVGGCALFRAPSSDGISAGSITISSIGPTVTLTPSGNPVHYMASDVPPQVFAPGTTLTVSASGADVPAFNTTVTSPVMLAGFTAPTTISRAAGYAATWTRETGQMWLFVVSQASNSTTAPLPMGETDLLLCKVPDTGSYTVTSAALALFPTAVDQVIVALARVDEHDLHLGDGEVDVVALNMALNTASTSLTP